MSVIETKIRNFLGTRAVPRHLANDGAREEVIGQIVGVVSKHAPDSDVESWIGQVIEKAMIAQKGNAWPSVQVWAIAVGGVAHESAGPVKDSGAYDPHSQTFGDRVFAERLIKGEAVGEHDVFGARADRCLREGRFGLDRLRSYQKAFYYKHKDIYGPESAKRFLAERAPALFAEMFPSIEADHAEPQENMEGFE